MKWKKDEAKQRPRPESASDTEGSGSGAVTASPASSSCTTGEADESAPQPQHSGATARPSDNDLNANEHKTSDICRSGDADAAGKINESAKLENIAKSHSFDSRSSENDTASSPLSNLSP